MLKLGFYIFCKGAEAVCNAPTVFLAIPHVVYFDAQHFLARTFENDRPKIMRVVLLATELKHGAQCHAFAYRRVHASPRASIVISSKLAFDGESRCPSWPYSPGKFATRPNPGSEGIVELGEGLPDVSGVAGFSEPVGT
jgi:hypothetical protein